MKSTPATGTKARAKPKRKPTILGTMSYRDVARRAKIHYSYVRLIVKGERMPGSAVLARLAVVLGMSMEQLYGRLAAIRRDRERAA